jgi:hypothetical protein
VDIVRLVELEPAARRTYRDLVRDSYLGGMGILAIHKKLLAEGVDFSKNGLIGLLRNEKYAGDLLLQKTFVADHLTKKKKKNTGQLPMYYVRDAHEAIIPRWQFEAVKAEMARRSARHHQTIPPGTVYNLSSKIRCGICGAPYRHKIAGSEQKYKKPVWICATFNTLGKEHCASQQIPDDIMQAKLAEAGGPAGLQEIRVLGPGRLAFAYTDGRRVDLPWQNPSRRESWTPAMKEAARQKENDRRAAQ